VLGQGRHVQREASLLPTNPHDLLRIDLRRYADEQRPLRRVWSAMPPRELLFQQSLLSDRHGESSWDLLSLYAPEL
jgi:hypothetical protein